MEAAMTMLSTHAAHAATAKHWWPTYAFLRALALIAMIVEVHNEANQIARAAHRRFPFAEW
jgi:hypothetical protein